MARETERNRGKKQTYRDQNNARAESTSSALQDGVPSRDRESRERVETGRGRLPLPGQVLTPKAVQAAYQPERPEGGQTEEEKKKKSLQAACIPPSCPSPSSHDEA